MKKKKTKTPHDIVERQSKCYNDSDEKRKSKLYIWNFFVFLDIFFFFSILWTKNKWKRTANWFSMTQNDSKLSTGFYIPFFFFIFILFFKNNFALLMFGHLFVDSVFLLFGFFYLLFIYFFLSFSLLIIHFNFTHLYTGWITRTDDQKQNKKLFFFSSLF